MKTFIIILIIYYVFTFVAVGTRIYLEVRYYKANNKDKMIGVLFTIFLCWILFPVYLGNTIFAISKK